MQDMKEKSFHSIKKFSYKKKGRKNHNDLEDSKKLQSSNSDFLQGVGNSRNGLERSGGSFGRKGLSPNDMFIQNGLGYDDGFDRNGLK